MPIALLLIAIRGAFAAKQQARMGYLLLRGYAIRSMIAAFSLFQTGSKRVGSGHTYIVFASKRRCVSLEN
jgi:hypothetical protein